MTGQRYRVRMACEVMGAWREAGEVITLTAAQAEQLAPPFGSVVDPVSLLDHDESGRMGGSPPGGLAQVRRKRARDNG